MDRILKKSALFCKLFKYLVVLYPLYVVLDWMGVFPDVSIYQLWGFPLPLEKIPMNLRLYAAVIDMLPTAIVSLCFYYLYRLFKLYAEGYFFTLENIYYINRIGHTLFWKVLAWILVQPAISFTLSSHLVGEKQRLIMVSLQSADISNLMCGAIVILISWIMNEAKKNQEELALTV